MGYHKLLLIFDILAVNKNTYFACSLVFSVIAAISNHITLLPENFANFAVFPCTVEECNIRPYSPHRSSITRMCRKLAQDESRIARSVTMERRLFARTLL